MTKRRCPQCGAELPPDSPEGLCPQCLLKFGLASESSVEDDEGPTAPLPSPKKDPAVGQQIGPYRIVQLLGEGGMGMVYLAQQEKPIRRRVALKIIKLGMDTREVIARFESERQALAMMDHANIAKVFDAGASDQGRPFFVMEYVPGIPITDYCDKHRLSNRERLGLFTQICQAIQHAHQKGIIHRDIKPSNVLVSIQDGKPVPKIIDFGVAKAINQRLTEKTLFTEQGLLIGTPEYMSPEQAEMTGLDVDTTTDIYSLGVLLYELLVGALPFDPQMLRRAGYDEIRRIIREEEPPNPTTRLHSLGATAIEIAKRRHTNVASLEKQLRGDLDWIIMKAMEKDRTRRYASASEFAADIGRHVDDEPVIASPPSVMYRLGKFVKKNKGPVAAVLTIMIVLAIGLTVSLLMYSRAEVASAQARRESYIANFSSAVLHLNSSRIAEARRRLEACDQDLRGWEWRYANFQANSSLLTYELNEPATSASFSSDGSKIFYLLKGNPQIETLDASTSSAPQRFGLPVVKEKQVKGPPYVIAFSQEARRTARTNWIARSLSMTRLQKAFLLTASGESNQLKDSLEIVDGSTGLLISRLELPNSGVLRVDGTGPAAFGSDAGYARVYDPRISVLKSGSYPYVISASFSPDGQKVAAWTWDSVIRVWYVNSGQTIANLPGHTDGIISVVFSSDGERIASGSFDGTARVWDLRSRKQIAIFQHDGAVFSLAFSPDGRQLLSGSEDKIVRIWDVSLQKAISVFHGHGGAVTAVAFHSNGTRIVSGAADGTLHVRDLPSGKVVATLFGHSSGITSVAFRADGRRIISAGLDKTIRLWDPTFQNVVTTFKASQGSVISLAFKTDSQHIVAGSLELTLEALSGKSVAASILIWQPFLRNAIPLFKGAVHTVASSPDGKIFAVALEDKTILLCDTVSGKVLRTLSGPQDRTVAIVFSPSGREVAAASEDKTIRVWEVSSGKLLTSLKGFGLGATSSAYDVPALCFNPDGSRIVSTFDDATIRVWSISSGRPLVTFKGEAGVVAFDRSGQWIISGSEDGRLLKWDANTGRLIRATKGHEGIISCIAFSPDGSRIATGSQDNTVKVWDTTSLTPLITLADHPDAYVYGDRNHFVSSIAFSPDGDKIVSGSGDGTIKVWNSRPSN